MTCTRSCATSGRSPRTLDERKAVARKLQENAWTYVPMALLGQWAPPVAMRANLRGFLPIPAHVPFWNVEKT